MVLKGCFHVRTSLSRLRVSNIFGVRAGFDLDATHIFPQGVLVTITLIGGVVAVRGSKGCTRCEAGLPFWSVAVTALSGMWSVPQLLEIKP